MIRQRPLPYQSFLAQRALDEIDLLVVHCTELPDLATARAYGERLLYPLAGNRRPADYGDDSGEVQGTGNSGHYYIDRDGSIEQWVHNDRVAHHVRGFNPRSIGVELVNRGRYPDWYHSGRQQMTEPYPAAQINALLSLTEELHQSLPTLRWIAGHDQLDPECIAAEDDTAIQIRRKLDPGSLFPWQAVLTRCPLQYFTP